MIRSMTGYGKANLEKNSRKYQVEIRSVNHRYLDISVRMPRALSYLEETVKGEISKNIKRGKIDVFISFENNSLEGRKISINKELAKEYIRNLKELAIEEDLVSEIKVNDIARYPEVLSIQDNQDDDTIKEEIDNQDDDTIKEEMIEVVEIAVKNLLDMKKLEGEKIAKDLNNRLEFIKEKINELSELSTGLISEYVVKLEERIKQLLKEQEIDKSRLAEEVVIYADKCSIEEELTRLNSHISQFKNLLNLDGAIGKKLDFIVQEMNRETNTIGAKSGSLEITNDVIDLKTEIENIREQIQNIE